MIWVSRNTCCPAGRARIVVPGEAGPARISLLLLSKGGAGPAPKLLLLLLLSKPIWAGEGERYGGSAIAVGVIAGVAGTASRNNSSSSGGYTL
jgi:hypothetical protein